MMIQSLRKSPGQTHVVVLDVPVGATQMDVLRFIGDAPRGTMNTEVLIRDDYTGVHTAMGANVTYFTD